MRGRRASTFIANLQSNKSDGRYGCSTYPNGTNGFIVYKLGYAIKVNITVVVFWKLSVS